MIKTIEQTTGIFWVETESEKALWQGKFNLISHRGNDGHIRQWTIWQRENKYTDIMWYYWPRGRVTYNPSNRKHTIYLNPIISTPNVIQAIKERFNLTGISKITKDNSGEYDCIAFDTEWDDDPVI